MTISEAFKAYDIDKLYTEGKSLKTRKNYRSTLNSFLRSSSDLPVELVTYQSIVYWKMYMAQKGDQPSSMGSKLSHVREVLKYLKRRGFDVLDYKEIDRPHIPQKDPTWLDIEEVRRFLGVIDCPRDKALFACLFSSGARISELLSLNRDSIVDGKAGIIGKGDKPGVLFFDINALQTLNVYLKSRTDRLTPLFVSGQKRRITVSRIEQLAHEYADIAGINKNVTPHVFRHSHASDLKLNGADIYDISKQLRHSNISTTQIYTHIKDTKREIDYSKFHTPVPIQPPNAGTKLIQGTA